MSESDFGEALGKITASSYRERVLRVIDDSPNTPSNIADETGIDIAHVSRALDELKDIGCAKLDVPEETVRGRVHSATGKGSQVLKRVPSEE